MRPLILAILISGTASAQAPERGESVTFTRAELDAMQQQLEEVVTKREAAAFQAGRADARARCASLI
jgi:hypothetical protein